jgi:pyruvate dehydrogenase E2 component (dihydrolipoamide acetyltransferase)
MDLKLPPLGEGVDSGTVVSFLVKEGDTVTKGQGIIELETGKAVASVPASAAGKVTKLLVAVGDKIAVGQSILSLEGGSGAGDSAPAPAAAPSAVRTVVPRKTVAPVVAVPDEVPVEPELTLAEEPEDLDSAPIPPAAPSIRRIARELGINLRRIQGSARGGRVVMEDLRAYIARLERLAFAPKPAAKTAASATPTPAPAPVERIDFSKWGPVSLKPMTQLRKVIAQRMSENWLGVARVTQFEYADITGVMDLRKKYAEAYEKREARLTLTSFALKVVADALKKFPIFNASIDEVTQDVVFKEYYHIGMAVDTEQGLIVPVIRDADKKDLVALSKDVSDLAAKTRDRKVALADLQGGTFTISNQGGIGGGHFTPIVNKPEVGILGMGRGSMQAVVRDGKIEPRLLLPLALSYDHRLIDGGTAVRFMLEIVQGFEKFKEEDVKL